jgi:hypothetical protein
MSDARFPVEFVDLYTCVILPSVIARIPAGAIVGFRAFPVRMDGQTLVVAVEDSDDCDLRDKLRFVANQDVRLVSTTAAGIDHAIEEYLARE